MVNQEAQRAAKARYRNRNREKLRADSRVYYLENREKALATKRAWRENNPEYGMVWMSKFRSTEHGKEYTKLLRQKGQPRANERNRERRATDLKYRLKKTCARRILCACKSQGSKKAFRTLELLGMEILEFKIYIQGQFLPGMAWENHGPVWHLDHIRPCCGFDLSDPQQQKKCFNWSNYQPLFALDNLRKGGRCG